MSRVKEMFIEQRQWEEAQISKAFVKSNAKSIEKKIESGEIEPHVAFVQAKFLEDMAKEVKAVAEKYAVNFESAVLPPNMAQVKVSIREGYETLDYEQDAVYADLKAKLKSREEQLKSAYQNSRKFGSVIANEETGEVVPIVPVKSVSKAAIIVSY